MTASPSLTKSPFLLTRPMRGATFFQFVKCHFFQFLLTRLLRGATQIKAVRQKGKDISTHTPLARRDRKSVRTLGRIWYFYSHASCEARLNFLRFPLLGLVFLLTRLLRGATLFYVCPAVSAEFLLTRLLRGATQLHAAGARARKFLLTRLLRGATTVGRDKIKSIPFLLTRLLRGATSITETAVNDTRHFYSHASCEARRKRRICDQLLGNFYSHASCEARHLSVYRS